MQSVHVGSCHCLIGNHDFLACTIQTKDVKNVHIFCYVYVIENQDWRRETLIFIIVTMFGNNIKEEWEDSEVMFIIMFSRRWEISKLVFKYMFAWLFYLRINVQLCRVKEFYIRDSRSLGDEVIVVDLSLNSTK